MSTDALDHQTHDQNIEQSGMLSSVFALSAIGGLASLALLGIADPLTMSFGAAAVISGTGLAVQKLPPVVSASVITAAITTFALGLPMEFLTEHIVFPYAHESALGKETIGWSSSMLVPFYDAVGQFFGVEPLGQAIEGVPQADF